MGLIEKDKKYIWHPFTQMKTAEKAIPIVKGEGTLLIDEKGNTYIDAISSWWVNLHGHSHPYIAEKVYAQMQTLEHVVFAGFTHNPAVELCEKLSKNPGIRGKGENSGISFIIRCNGAHCRAAGSAAGGAARQVTLV